MVHADSPNDSSESEEDASAAEGSETGGKVAKKVTIAAPRRKSVTGAGVRTASLVITAFKRVFVW